jgi:aminomethyltransferase
VAQKTVLFDIHERHGGRMVEFSGWQLPLHFGSQLEEHHSVRRDAGMFDVSHMTVIDLAGRDSGAFLSMLLANDIRRLQRPGQALYSCMLDEAGGILDDLMIYRWAPDRFRIIANAATRAKDLAWIGRHAEGFEIAVNPREDLAIIAVQGPSARPRTDACLNEALRRAAAELGVFEGVLQGDWQVSRTGYTGEDGYEIVLPHAAAAPLWQALLDAGVRPCGLGARDTLRLEAGMRLYGVDMDETVSPLEAGLGWTVAWQPEARSFIGRAALETQRQTGGLRRFVGLILQGMGVLRSHQRVIVPGIGEGEITSGGFSPVLNRGIGFARLPAGDFTRCQVEVRGQLKEAAVTAPRFVRHGSPVIPVEPVIR